VYLIHRKSYRVAVWSETTVGSFIRDATVTISVTVPANVKLDADAAGAVVVGVVGVIKN